MHDADGRPVMSKGLPPLTESEQAAMGGHSMHITVMVRTVYGNDLVYPVDETAIKFAALLRVKTFNAHQVNMIKSLGYAVHVTAGQLPF